MTTPFCVWLGTSTASWFEPNTHLLTATRSPTREAPHSQVATLELVDNWVL